MPAAAVIRKMRALSGFIGFKGSVGGPPNAGLPWELGVLNVHKEGGIRGVAVKCLDITKNSDCEGSLLGHD